MSQAFKNQYCYMERYQGHRPVLIQRRSSPEAITDRSIRREYFRTHGSSMKPPRSEVPVMHLPGSIIASVQTLQYLPQAVPSSMLLPLQWWTPVLANIAQYSISDFLWNKYHKIKIWSFHVFSLFNQGMFTDAKNVNAESASKISAHVRRGF